MTLQRGYEWENESKTRLSLPDQSVKAVKSMHVPALETGLRLNLQLYDLSPSMRVETRTDNVTVALKTVRPRYVCARLGSGLCMSLHFHDFAEKGMNGNANRDLTVAFKQSNETIVILYYKAPITLSILLPYTADSTLTISILNHNQSQKIQQAIYLNNRISALTPSKSSHRGYHLITPGQIFPLSQHVYQRSPRPRLPRLQRI